MLQQATALMPFMRQFVTLTVIAEWTGNYQVVRVITATARQRNNMVNVIDFVEFLMAVVAFTLLISILFLNILSSMLALSRSSTVVLHSTIEIPLRSIRSIISLMISIILALCFPILFWRNFMVDIAACFTPATKSIGISTFSTMKVVKSSWFKRTALGAVFLWKITHYLNRLSFSRLTSSCCQSAKANTSSHGLITPLLGNMPIIAFFPYSAKAETGGLHD